ncbi:MAG TPA: HAMP domain-containing sensor histidine kinase [Thermoanaerobaculia bacterium]|nr:HAMP domain-containing sensor histidine kinase [Thermoanaerobaculia bacterium]
MSREPTKEPPLKPEEMVRVFSVLAHDLKSPIFSIDGFSELLQTDYADKLDDDGRDFLGRIRSSARHMKDVLDEMSHVVKVLTRPDSRRRVDLGEVLEEVRLRHANLIDESGATLSVSGQAPMVEADPEKLREAISVLICNAITFTDRPAGERRVDVSFTEAGGKTSICVADNGIGLDAKYADQIFELGLKLDKQRGIGAGYGLFLARRVAESHGGAVTVDSTLGNGSRFCLTLPSATTSRSGDSAADLHG